MMSTKIFHLIIVALCMFTLSSQAQVIYNYTDDSNGIPASVDPNATGTNLIRVNGALSSNACPTGYNSRGFSSSTTYSSSMAAIQWSMTPNAGYELNIQSMTVGVRRNASGPASARLAYSLDGTNWTDQGSNQTVPTASCGTSTNLTWNMTDFTSSTVVYFRVYAFNAASTNGQFQLRNVTVSGVVSPFVVLGCTDPAACNYDPAANTDDGSCTYGGCTDPLACNYDPAAACDDGSCIVIGDPCDDGDWTTSGDFIQGDCNCIGYPDNDEKAGAVYIDLVADNACEPMTAALHYATTSGDSQSSATTGEDIWYTFDAVTNAIRMELYTPYFDGIFELQDDLGNMIDFENVRTGVGNEILNFDGLTEGQTYYLIVRNYDSNAGTGFIDMCLTYVRDSFVEILPAGGNPCSTAKSKFVGAYSTRYIFESVNTGNITSLVRVGSTYFAPKDVPGVTWNDTFLVDVEPTIHLYDALGNLDVITITTADYTPITFPVHPNMQLNSAARCSNGNVTLSTVISGDPFVCLSVNYEWEFTRTDVPSAPFYHLRGAANRFMNLGTVPGLVQGATYDVRVRPIFAGGAGNWGPVQCMQLAAPLLSAMTESNVFQEMPSFRTDEPIDLTPYSLQVFPNPATGEGFTISYPGLDEWEMAEVAVFDATGRAVYSSMHSGAELVNLEIRPQESMAPGHYIIHVMAGDSGESKVIIIRD